jgi:hypothetical protein
VETLPSRLECIKLEPHKCSGKQIDDDEKVGTLVVVCPPKALSSVQ